MSEETLQAQIGAANAYEALFVPGLFGPWAARVADAARIEPGDRVLDVACGTGVLAREAAKRAGPQGRVAGLDPNPGMLAAARDIAPGIEWYEGVAESIPLDDEQFTAVVSQFGLMFFEDRRRAIQEMLRVLAPGGRMAVAVWDSAENIPVYAAEIDLLERMAGREAADALRAPFVLGNGNELASLFKDAGVDPVAVATHRGQARFPDVRTLVEADLRGWLPVMGVHLSEEQISSVLAEAEGALVPHLSEREPAVFEVSAHIATAQK